MKYYLYLAVLVLFFNCKQEATLPSVTSIVDNSIEISGGETFKHSEIEFNFRDKLYSATRQQGDFKLTRAFVNEEDSVLDVLSNTGFERYINNGRVVIPDSIKANYSASVNSVHYFSVLPYGLNDEAVNKTLLGIEHLKGADYFKVKVTFSEEGGGEDFEDVFIYWIHTTTFKVDYLAYSYNESDGKGLRFREAYNERYVKSLRFVDYNNYKPNTADAELKNLGKLFEENALKLLSKIELKDISVSLIDN